eukprot:963092-Prorocentrum_minimum.AAC.1
MVLRSGRVELQTRSCCCFSSWARWCGEFTFVCGESVAVGCEFAAAAVFLRGRAGAEPRAIPPGEGGERRGGVAGGVRAAGRVSRVRLVRRENIPVLPASDWSV